MKVVLASKNPHKLVEISKITEKIGYELVLESDVGVDIDVEETGSTFEENSFKKANEIMKLCGRITLADDSGLEVDYLDGAPGVYSARFAGEDGNDAKNNEKLLKLLDGAAPEARTARFVSVITMVYPDGTVLTARGECPGRILEAPAGENGFGYDPLFVPDGCDVTFAQLGAEEKNRISHRAKALEKLEDLLQERK